jgi:hypothetical protein
LSISHKSFPNSLNRLKTTTQKKAAALRHLTVFGVP